MCGPDLVAMNDPDTHSSNYCDMAENKAKGYKDGVCYELDLLEANNNGGRPARTRMQNWIRASVHRDHPSKRLHPKER